MSDSASTIPGKVDDGASGNKLFPEKIEVRGPRGFRAALRAVAMRKHTHSSEVIRQIVIAGLEAEGVTLPVEAAE